MSHVLGIVIKAMDAKYAAMCDKLQQSAELTWSAKHGREPSSIRRYPWPEFDAYQAAMTRQLRGFGIQPIDFQRHLIPSLFSKLLTSRVVQRVFAPERLLRAVDIWAGPFMFRCGTSRVEIVSDGRFRLVITIHDDLSASPEFFEQCTAGLAATFELIFPRCRMTPVLLNERQLAIDVDSTQTSIQGRFDPPHLSVLNDLLQLIDDVVQDLESPGFVTHLNMEEWHESIDHIDRVARVMRSQNDSVADQLTIVSSRVQMAALGSANHQGVQMQLLTAAMACRALRDEMAKAIP